MSKVDSDTRWQLFRGGSREDTMGWWERHDLIQRWIDERVVVEDGTSVSSSTALGDFYDWLGRQGSRETVTSQQWGTALKGRRFHQEEREDEGWVVLRMRLRD